jgi:hypothetical protein
MKKIFLASIALLSVMIFASCSEDNTPAQKAEGKYMVKRETNMVNLPAHMPFTPLTEQVTLVVKATSDNHGSITIPSTTYLMMGNEMTIPAFTIPNVPMLDDMENGTFIPTHQFVIDGEKYIEGTINGEIEEDGDVEIDLTYKYGSMPFAIKQEFESWDECRM